MLSVVFKYAYCFGIIFMRYDMLLILVGHILCIAFRNIGYTRRKKLQNRPLLRAEKYLEASRLGP